MSKNQVFEDETGKKLPRNMEVRKMKRGGFSFRLMLPDRSRVALGWNYDEAMDRYRELTVGRTEDDAAAMANEILQRHRKGAKARGIDFKVDAEYIRQLLVDQRFRCAVTGRRFSLEKLAGVRNRPYAPSLDRIRSGEAYAPGNCRLVCAAVNAAIADLGDAAFMSLFEPMVRQMVREEVAKLMGTTVREAA